ncbi:hypothetical protein BJX63DRAFT_380353 [Aspergillus granulosus]|uniref:Uncharacterized protein n=1 Tax=Aspergillus granulosus TaxID=176169 RepID=A0ABR4I039_9EURO
MPCEFVLSLRLNASEELRQIIDLILWCHLDSCPDFAKNLAIFKRFEYMQIAADLRIDL